MANFMVKIKGATRSVPQMAHQRGLVGLATDKAIRLGGAFGIGYGKGYYRERFMIAGKPADAVVGGAAMLVGAALEILAGGNSKYAPYLNAVGDTALGSYLNSIGASMGTKKSGRQVYISAPGMKPAALPAGLTAVQGDEVLGAQDGLGAYLSAEDIMKHSAQR
jgi:hypothetical protein